MAVTTYKLCTKPITSPPSGIAFYICDTEGDRPSSGLSEGDQAWTKDTDKLWCADSATTWKEIAGSGGGGADVKSGTVSIQENGTADITFTTAFSATPVVVANVQDSGEYNNIQITAVSTTGATLALEKVGGGAASTYTVGWIATDAGN